MHLKAKAHETLTLLRFIAETVPAWQDRFHNGPDFAKGAALLLRLYTLLQGSPVQLPAATVEACWACKRQATHSHKKFRHEYVTVHVRLSHTMHKVHPA